MPVTLTLTPVLREKIARRAKRAFRRFDEGDQSRQHRILNLTKDSLDYRLPRSNRKTVEVIRKDDGTVVVDPPTTGLIELLTNADIERLKNHAGEVQGFVRVPPKKKMLVVGEILSSQYFIESRQRVAEKLQPDQRVFRVQANVSAIEKDKIESDKVLLSSLEVLAELDLVKDFGYTDDLLDLATDYDLVKLKKHVGRVRAYMYVEAGTDYQVASTYLDWSKPLRSREQAINQCKQAGDHVYIVEVEYDEIANGKNENDPFTAREYEITGVLDPEKDLGFTTGLFDCRTKADVEKLRKRRHLGRVRAYKHVTKDLKSPHQTGTPIQYKIGEVVEVKNAVTNENQDCAAGVNLACPSWCDTHKKPDHRGLAFEFDMADLAAVPVNTDGKFRVFRALCVEEVDIDNFLPLTPPSPVPAPTPPPPTDAPEGAAPNPQAKKQTKKKRGVLDKLLGRGDDKDE